MLFAEKDLQSQDYVQGKYGWYKLLQLISTADLVQLL